MKELVSHLRERYRNFYIVMLFIMGVVCVVWLMPREGKFRYEFQKGTPWLHENLIAPYDFPIYKTQEELEKEKDSIIHECKVYYRVKNEIKKRQIDSLLQKFHSRWNYLLKKYEKEKVNVASGTKEKYFHTAIQTFDYLYDKGIIEIPDVFDEYYNGVNDMEVIVKVMVDENVSEDRYYSDVYTSKTAYQYLISKFLELKIDKTDLEKKFLEELNLNEFIVPNLVYDAETTKKNRDIMISGISLTRGMITKGLLVIQKGDMVNEEKYRIMESYKIEYEHNNLGNNVNHYTVLLGQFILASFTMFVVFLFLYNFRRTVLNSALKTSFILLMFMLTIFMAVQTTGFKDISIYIVPFAIQPLLVRTFYDSRLAVFIHLITILLTGFIAPNGFEFVFMQMIAGFVGVVTITNMYTRRQLLISALSVFGTYSVLYFGIAIIQEGDFSKIEWRNFIWFAANSMLLLSCYPMIYIFETIFGLISDISLIELSNTNRPLLRRLSLEAPGTFQHCLQVANLAEAAIQRIGGNSALVRAGALYHDVGKMLKANYFIENQSDGINPHNELDFDKSAEIITNHVTSGVDLAHKYKVPDQIIDFILTHHGTSKVNYFYISYKNKYPDRSIDINKFMYHGKLPHSKETAVLMIADALEASSRTLKVINEQTISELVNRIIDNQIKDGQFDSAKITFYDVTQIKDEMKRKLLNIYHARIEYPKDKTIEKVN